MGIPFYFKNLLKTHSDVIKPLSQFKGCDRLFLDFNSIIHQSANCIVNKNPLAPYEKLERLVISEVLDQVVKLINVVFPKQLLFIGIDGTCPRSKMTQQRKRRYISAWRNELVQSFKAANNMLTSQWDSNIITPGTSFMKALDTELAQFVEKNNNKLGFRIILSPSSEPGEGEHKIMQFIKDDHSDHRDVIYGLDADLIMLSMISPNAEKIQLLRERPEFNIPLSTKPTDTYLLLDINMLQQSMYSAYNLPAEWDIQSFCKEYVMLCTLLGNDFFPPLSYLKIKENGIELLVNAYKKIKESINDNIIRKEGLNSMFLMQLFKDLAKTEDQYLKECCETYYHKQYRPSQATKPLVDVFTMELDNYPTINKFRHIIDPAQSGWRMHYYWHLFSTRKSSDIHDICINYMQGLLWVYNYYYRNQTCYSWYYRYCYSPTLLDLVNSLSSCRMDDLEATVTLDPHKDILLNNEIQLLMVLPPQSMNIIPSNLQKIMSDISLGALHFYPWKFTISTFLKTYLWECSAVIPDIEIEAIVAAYEKL